MKILAVAKLVDIPGNPTATRKKKRQESDKENVQVDDIVCLSKDATYHPTQRWAVSWDVREYQDL